MDQLKQFMAQAAKHQFWIISGLSVILGIVGFFLTSSTLGKLYTAQATALDQRYSDITTVRSSLASHPNDTTKEKMDAIIASVRDDVEAAWRLQYERQSKLLVWPEEALVNKRLIDKLKKYNPIETTLTYPEEPKDIVKTEREAYAIYFADQLPKIVKIIGTEWVGKANDNAAMGGMGGMGMGMGGMGEGGMGMGMGGMGEGGMGEGGMGMGMGMGGMGSGMGPGMLQSKDLVIWPKASQDELINSLRLWRGNAPNVYEILYTQENMWILEGIMRIIAKTNEGAKANFQTSIKEIEFIRIGKPAVGRAGTIDSAMAAGGMGMGGMGMGGMGIGMGGMGEMGSEGGMGDMGSSGGEGGMNDMGDMGSGGMGEMGMAGSEGGEGGEGGVGMVMTTDPANGRYVDAAYKPITGEELRTNLQSELPEHAYFAVAKRVPVRLRFKMDQRKVPQFLADCGNAALMLEIRQVRLGDTAAATAGGGSMGGMGMGGMGMGDMGGGGGGGRGMGGMGMGGMGMEGGSGMGGYGEGGDGMGGMGGMGMGGMGAIQAKPAWEMSVEVYGVVYLYNPVSIKRLGLDKVTEDTQVADTVQTPAVEEPMPGAVPPQTDNGAAANPANANGNANPKTNGDGSAPLGNDPSANPPANPGTGPTGTAPGGANAGGANAGGVNAGGNQPPANPQ